MSTIGYLAPFDVFFMAKVLRMELSQDGHCAHPFSVPAAVRCAVAVPAVREARISVDVALPTGQERFRSMVSIEKRRAQLYAADPRSPGTYLLSRCERRNYHVRSHTA